MSPGVVMSSTLAAVAAACRMGALACWRASPVSTLTTAIVREGMLVRIPLHHAARRRAHLTPQALLDEIYPLAAYYQDSWSEGIAQVRLAGLGDRTAEFREPLERELNCPVAVADSAAAERKESSARTISRWRSVAWKR